MLTKIKIKNFKSFRNETIIDANSTNYKMLSDTNVKDGILKGLLFVGPNASGKTNAILSIKFLLELLFKNENISLHQYFCLFSDSKDLSMEYTFNFDNKDIIYGFIINYDRTIKKEFLIFNGETKINRIGTSVESVVTDKKYFDSQDVIKDTLFIRNIYFNTKFAKYPTLAKCFDFLNNSIYVNAVMRTTETYNNKSLIINKYIEKYGIKKINDFFRYHNFNQQILYDTELNISKFINLKVLDEKEIFLKRNNLDIWMPLTYESLGNQTLLNMLPAILYAIENSCILIIDEFSSAFHNDLEELIIKYFMVNSINSQVFFISHSTNLLSTTLLRPDQIYSTNFVDENGTYLKRFSSEGPRESQNLEKMYLNGVFDGIPNYNNPQNQN